MKMPVEKCHVDEYPVLRTEDLGEGWFRLDIEAPEIARATRAGQFVQVRIGPEDDPLIRRPFSVYDVGPEPGENATEVRLLIQKVGPGTRAISQLDSGDSIRLMGPLGNPMPVPEINSEGALFLVGGGIGVAPLYLYCRERKSENSNLPLKVLLGARRESLLIGQQGFIDLGVDTGLATDDGSAGHHGNVIELLDQELSCLPITWKVWFFRRDG